MNDLPTLIDDYLHAYFTFYPEQATARGFPGFDDCAPVRDNAAIRALHRAITRTAKALAKLPIDDSDMDAAIDAECLRMELETATFTIDALAWPQCNPLWYIEPGLDAIDTLDFRLDLEEHERHAHQRARLLGLEVLLRNMETGLESPMQPYLNLAIDMLTGFESYLDEGFAGADEALNAATETARRAVSRAIAYLRGQTPTATAFQPMGKTRYLRILRRQHLIDDDLQTLILRAQEALADAERELDAVERLPQSILPHGGEVTRDDVLAYYRDEVEHMREAVLGRDLVTIPDGAVEVVETPPHQQALHGGASYLPPPVYGVSRVGHFFISAVQQPFDPSIRDYYYDLIRNRRARNLVAHEVYPGHHLQFLHAAAHPSPIRKVRDNDVMIEGWALYCEHLMREQGLFDEMPSARPWRALKLRALRVIVDIGIHTGSMTLAEARRYMESHYGGAPSPWIGREVNRYAAEPTQAMSYLVGRHQVLTLREDWQRAIGKEGFALKDFHDRFLAEGSIPIALIRQKMLSAHDAGL